VIANSSYFFELIEMLNSQEIERERERTLYLPRYRASPRNMTPIAAAMAIDNGLKIDIYTGPFKCRAQVWTTELKDEANPCSERICPVRRYQYSLAWQGSPLVSYRVYNGN
jgi:hypothetical protein